MALDPLLNRLWGSRGSMPSPFGDYEGNRGFANIAEPIDINAPPDPTGVVKSLYQDYLGRDADPGGLSNWVNAYNTFAKQSTDSPTAQYLGPTGGYQYAAEQTAKGLFDTPEGQAFAKSMWDQSTTGNQPTGIGIVGGQAAPLPAAAPAAAPVPAAGGGGGGDTGGGAGGGGGGTGGFDMASALQSLAQFAPGGANAFAPQAAPFSDFQKANSSWFAPPQVDVPKLDFGLKTGGGAVPPGSQSAPPFGYMTSQQGGLPPGFLSSFGGL